MTTLGVLRGIVSSILGRIETARVNRRWAHLRALGMHIGEDVFLPPSTRIDVSHCFLISIGDHCGFGEDCLILAHDAQMDEYLDAARIGRVIIHESCHIGARSVILPGVEIGPRTLVGANSVVSKSLPPDSVYAGSPAKLLCTLQEYLDRHKAAIAASPQFPHDRYSLEHLDLARRVEMVDAVRTRDAYIVGGRSAELRGEGKTPRTPSHPAHGE